MSVVFTQKALDDLLAHDDRQIAIGSKLRASSLVLDGAERLANFPNWGPLVSDATLSARGFRKLLCSPYVAYYRVNDAGDVVVYRVFHQRQDYTRKTVE